MEPFECIINNVDFDNRELYGRTGNMEEVIIPFDFIEESDFDKLEEGRIFYLFLYKSHVKISFKEPKYWTKEEIEKAEEEAERLHKWFTSK